jgi:hypothetical protein
MSFFLGSNLLNAYFVYKLFKLNKSQNIKKDDIIIEIQNKSVKASGEVLQIIDEVVSQGKENVLIVFYSGPNSKKYIGARLSLD